MMPPVLLRIGNRPGKTLAAGNQVKRTARQDLFRQARDRPQLPEPSGALGNHDGDPLRRGGQAARPEHIRQPAQRGRLEAAQSVGYDPPGLCAVNPARREPPGCPPRPMPQRPFFFCSGAYYSRLVAELRPLTYGLVGRKTKLMPKDEWVTILGHSPDVADALIQSMILTS